MAQPIGTPIRCPQCGQPFSAVLEQLIDVGRDPQAKLRLLSGRTNVVRCPHCGFNAAVQTPLVYHDPAKELFIAFVPMSLNLPKAEQERMIGDMQRRLMNSLPPEQRKGYLFTPRMALTMQGLIDQILEADGITAEVRQKQQARIDLIQKLIDTPEDQLPAAVQAHNAEIDAEFLQLLAASIQVTAQQGQGALAERMARLSDRLMELSSAGRETLAAMQRQDAAMAWAEEALNKLGAAATRDQLVDLVLSADGDEEKVEALVAMTWPAMDYQFFETFTTRLETRPAAEQEQLTQLRDTLLELTAEAEQQNRAVMQRAVNTLNAILAEPDLDAAIRKHINEIDNMFMAVLSANIQEAQKRAEIALSARLKQIYERIAALVQEGAPPEVQFVNALLNAPDDAAAEKFIRERAGQLDPGVLELLDVVIQDLEAQEQGALADRLRGRRAQVAEVLGPQARA